jgi:exodeoxyribonuclease VII small subunit
MSDTMRYEDAITELQEIVASMESGELPVDALSDKVGRAAVLIAFCRKKLLATDQEVQAVLDDLRGRPHE